jgi:hypothetical protein
VVSLSTTSDDVAASIPITGTLILNINDGSLAESVGGLRFGEGAECMTQSYFERTIGAKPLAMSEPGKGRVPVVDGGGRWLV